MRTAVAATLLAAMLGTAERPARPPVRVSTGEMLQAMREVNG